MADVVAGQCRDSRYPEPLSAVQLRAMYRRNRTPEVRALLWEIDPSKPAPEIVGAQLRGPHSVPVIWG